MTNCGSRDSLLLPTTEVAGRDEYEPMALLVRGGVIAQAAYPIPFPRAHIPEVLAWLQGDSDAGTGDVATFTADNNDTTARQ